jgi:hypothetical protein
MKAASRAGTSRSVLSGLDAFDAAAVVCAAAEEARESKCRSFRNVVPRSSRSKSTGGSASRRSNLLGTRLGVRMIAGCCSDSDADSDAESVAVATSVFERDSASEAVIEPVVEADGVELSLSVSDGVANSVTVLDTDSLSVSVSWNDWVLALSVFDSDAATDFVREKVMVRVSTTTSTDGMAEPKAAIAAGGVVTVKRIPVVSRITNWSGAPNPRAPPAELHTRPELMASPYPE